MIQVDGNGCILADVGFKGLFTADGFPFPLADNRAVVDAAREFVEALAHLTKLLRESVQRGVSQIQSGKYAHAMHLFRSLLPHAPDFLYL